MSMILSGVGRLGKEPQMVYTDRGTARTFINVATDAGFGDKKETIWIGLTAWGALAETLNQYLQKGSQIAFVAEATQLSTYGDEKVAALYGKILKVDFLSNIAKQEAAAEPEDF